MKVSKIGILSSAIIGAMALSSPSFAAEWESKKASNSEQIFVATKDNSAITFLCVGDKLRAAIAVEESEGSEVMNSLAESTRRISRNVTIDVAGKTPLTSRWRLNPTTDVYMTPSRKETLRLYNAAVTQTEATIKRGNKTIMSLSFPKPNQNFAEFGANCGVGTKRETT